jgi:hypothetical protein
VADFISVKDGSVERWINQRNIAWMVVEEIKNGERVTIHFLAGGEKIQLSGAAAVKFLQALSSNDGTIEANPAG